MKRATSPQDCLEFKGAHVALPPTLYPVGTPFPLSLLLDDGCDKSGYYVNLIMKQAESRTRKTCMSLKRQGYAPWHGRKLAPHTQEQLDKIREIVTKADSVEVAGHYPNGMHVTGTISNQCYLQDGQCHGGVEWVMFLLFRKRIAGNDCVYIHPEPVYDERRYRIAQEKGRVPKVGRNEKSTSSTSAAGI